MQHVFVRMGPYRHHPHIRGPDPDRPGNPRSLEQVMAAHGHDYQQLREAFRFASGAPMSACKQAAQFMKYVKGGDMIVIRHVYPKCPYLPTPLKTLEDGLRYPAKGVYALLKVVQRPTAAMVGTRSFGDTDLGVGIAAEPWAVVEPIGMGFIADLADETMKYFKGCLQATLAPMKKVSDGGKFTPAHRADFVRNATMKIVPAEFPDFEVAPGGGQRQSTLDEFGAGQAAAGQVHDPALVDDEEAFPGTAAALAASMTESGAPPPAAGPAAAAAGSEMVDLTADSDD